MNELTTISNAELDKRIEEVKERELSLRTDSGKNYMLGKMRELIGLLETWGYKFQGDEMALAKLWTLSLQEEFARLGIDGMTQAVTNWAAKDTNEYRAFPHIPSIKLACNEIGGDPRIEKGRRVQAEAERQMELDHQNEIEKFKREHPDLWARVEKRVKEYEHDNNILE